MGGKTPFSIIVATNITAQRFLNYSQFVRHIFGEPMIVIYNEIFKISKLPLTELTQD